MFFLTSPFSKIVSKLERNEARQYIYVYIYIYKDNDDASDMC